MCAVRFGECGVVITSHLSACLHVYGVGRGRSQGKGGKLLVESLPWSPVSRLLGEVGVEKYDDAGLVRGGVEFWRPEVWLAG
jgi:hypothetical protein